MSIYTRKEKDIQTTKYKTRKITQTPFVFSTSNFKAESQNTFAMSP